jgi:hypothetical protein
MKTSLPGVGAALLVSCALIGTGSAFAQPPPFDRHPPPHGAPAGHPPGYHGAYHFTFAHRDFAHFLPAERANWIGGRWAHSWHNGRYGWWWFAGGTWYFYAAPVYPYPTYVSDYYAADDGGGPMWYYCGNPQGYYPYVPRCSLPWQPVPAEMSPPQGGPGYGQPPANGPGSGPDYQPPNDMQR